METKKTSRSYWTFITYLRVLSYRVPFIRLISLNYFSKIFTFNFLSIGFGLLLPWFININHYKTVFGKIVTHISIISFSIYLIHLSIVQKFITHLTFPTTINDSLIFVPIYLILVILLSSVNYYVYERPMMNLRDLFKKH